MNSTGSAQLMSQMNQLVLPLNALRFNIQTNTAKANCDYTYIFNMIQQYNVLLSKYNNLHIRYQLILASSTYINININITPKIISPNWTELASMPGLPCSNGFQINNDEFIFANSNSNEILNYNTKTDSWHSFLKYPSTFKLNTDCPIIFNPDTNELYLINTLTNSHDSSPIQSHLTTINLNSFGKNKYNFTQINRSDFAGSALLIDDNIHCFGGVSNTTHRIINNRNKLVESKKEICNLSQECIGNVEHGLIHLKNGNKILFFGGMNIPDYGNAFDNIYNYNIITQKWKILQTKLPYKMYGFGHVLTADNKCIILFGGGKCKQSGGRNSNVYEFINDIFITELDTMVIKQSKLKCPKKGLFKAISMVDNNFDLVNGFIKKNEFKNNFVLPNDLYTVINNYYKEEYIYIIHSATGKHWKVDVVNILSNIK